MTALPSVSVVVPFYGDNPLRRRTLEIVEAFYRAEFPGWHLLIGEGPSAAAARNDGAARSDSDVLLFNDADSLCPANQILDAVRLAGEAPGLVFAFTVYHRLSERESAKITVGNYYDVAAAPVEWTLASSGSSGCVAIGRACFEQVGGYDESYLGRGYEDLAFGRACMERWPLRRVEGEMFHLWHGGRRDDDSPDDQDPAEQQANYLRFMEPV